MAPFRKLRTQLGLRKPSLGKHVHIGRYTYGIREDTVTEAKAAQLSLLSNPGAGHHLPKELP